jgi:hypothetical protein
VTEQVAALLTLWSWRAGDWLADAGRMSLVTLETFRPHECDIERRSMQSKGGTDS